MTPFLHPVRCGLLITAAITTTMPSPALSVDVADWLFETRWHSRVIFVFSASGDTEKFTQQHAKFTAAQAGLLERDVRVWFVGNNGSVTLDGNPQDDANANEIRHFFSLREGQFTVILIGKDGGIKLRQSQVLSSDQAFAIIDAMPMRQREIREGS